MIFPIRYELTFRIEKYFIIKRYEFLILTITNIAGGLGGLLLNVLKKIRL